MDGIARRTFAVLALALAAGLCAAAPALATDGSVKGKKWHDLNADGVKDPGEPVLKDWWIYLDTNRNGVRDSGEPAARTDASGNYAITGIRWWVPNHVPRTYDVREKPVASQPLPLDQCSFPAGCKHTLTFSNGSHVYTGKDFGNYQRGRIVVRKLNAGGTQTDAFDFSSATLGDFSLAASETAGRTFSSLEPGTYGIAELAHAGYTLTGAECSDGSDPATIELSSGETVTCTFTNTPKATVTVTKTEGGSTTLSENWRFVLSGGPGDVEIERATADGNPLGFGPLLPGAYTLCEIDLPDGWSSSLGTAVGGKVCVDLALEAGEAETVAVDNTRPAIDLLKQVRRSGEQDWGKDATLQAGQIAEYQLTVSNPGVGALIDVHVIDDHCDAAPLYADGDTDADSELDETETWTYRCDHVVTAADGAQFVNTAEATATDKRDNPVRDTDTATANVITPATPPTAGPPSQPLDQQQVLPEEITSGTARLRGPSGCARRSFRTTVSGRRIQRVTFYLDGRQLARVDARRGQKSFAVRIDPRKVGFGVHRVRARVVFAAGSRTATRTLRLSFQRCARQAGTPQFTG
jgi:Prealbumin-like fold domain